MIHAILTSYISFFRLNLEQNLEEKDEWRKYGLCIYDHIFFFANAIMHVACANEDIAKKKR